jgi:hypothetical protein
MQSRVQGRDLFCSPWMLPATPTATPWRVASLAMTEQGNVQKHI